jgi:hypothetical protein
MVEYISQGLQSTSKVNIRVKLNKFFDKNLNVLWWLNSNEFFLQKLAIGETIFFLVWQIPCCWFMASHLDFFDKPFRDVAKQWNIITVFVFKDIDECGQLNWDLTLVLVD